MTETREGLKKSDGVKAIIYAVAAIIIFAVSISFFMR